MKQDLISPQYKRGFTLFEILIAVLVLSIGLLGVAGLQLFGVRYSQGAMLKAQATVAANDIIDRMRTNTQAAINGSYDGTVGISIRLSAQTCATRVDGCSSADQAAQDRFEWDRLVDQLPSGRGTVARNANTFTVTLNWHEQSTTAETRQIELVAQIFP